LHPIAFEIKALANFMTKVWIIFIKLLWQERSLQLQALRVAQTYNAHLS